MAEYIERTRALDIAMGTPAYYFLKIEPAADVVEVVRCKDCKYYRPQVKSAQGNSKTNYCCRTAVIKVEPNDFCSFGAKMDGKGEGE